MCRYALNRKDHREDLEAFGCGLGCCVINELDNTLVVGMPECIYSYEPEGRGGALGFDGQKKVGRGCYVWAAFFFFLFFFIGGA